MRLAVLFVGLVVMKVSGLIATLPWWLVFMPLWILPAAFAVQLVTGLLLLILVVLVGGI